MPVRLGWHLRFLNNPGHLVPTTVYTPHQNLRPIRLTSPTWLPSRSTAGQCHGCGLCNILRRNQWGNSFLYSAICQKWATPDVGIMASRFNKKFDTFVTRSKDLLAFVVDALVILWTLCNLVYAFPVKLPPQLLCKIKGKLILIL